VFIRQQSNLLLNGCVAVNSSGYYFYKYV